MTNRQQQKGPISAVSLQFKQTPYPLAIWICKSCYPLAKLNIVPQTHITIFLHLGTSVSQHLKTTLNLKSTIKNSKPNSMIILDIHMIPQNKVYLNFTSFLPFNNKTMRKAYKEYNKTWKISYLMQLTIWLSSHKLNKATKKIN